jgi:hypothetical protein
MVYGDIISDNSWLPLKIREGVGYKQQKDAFLKEIEEFDKNVLVFDTELIFG